MIPVFDICQKSDCSLHITGISREQELYLSDLAELQPYDKFKYRDTVTINILEQVKFGTPETLNYTIVEHNSDEDVTFFKIASDGYYIVNHIILPTKECIESIMAKDQNFDEFYDAIYTSDGEVIYKYTTEGWVEVDVKELLRNNYSTTISISSKEIFSTCKLWDCYVNICKILLASPRCKDQNNSELIFNRDVVWMTLNVINYYTSKDQMHEAQRILDDVNSCNGFCKDSSIITKSKCNCGR